MPVVIFDEFLPIFALLPLLEFAPLPLPLAM
jgi:hypothetical protein